MINIKYQNSSYQLSVGRAICHCQFEILFILSKNYIKNLSKSSVNMNDNCEKHDDMLFELLKETKTIPKFFNAIFGFLNRR